MKTCTKLLFFAAFFITIQAHSQVKIGDNAKSINPNSLLELESSTKGLLLPRLTNDQIKAMTNVPVGMLLFSSTDSALYLRKDTGWAILGFKTSTTSSQWASHGNDIYNTNGGKVGIGTSTPYSLLSNTPNNVLDKEGYGGNAAGSFNWVSSGFGYAGMISNFGDGRGLLVRTSEGSGNSLEVDAGDNNLLNVLASGNVGIGTATPAAKLDVKGTVMATNFAGNGHNLTGLHISQIDSAVNAWKPIFYGALTAPSFKGDGSQLTGLNVSQVNGAAPISNPSFQGNVSYSGTLNMGVQYVITNYTIPGNSYATINAGCPTGTKLIGGGGGHRDYNSAQYDITVNYSGPDPSNPNYWRLLCDNSSGKSRAIVVYAICAKVQ